MTEETPTPEAVEEWKHDLARVIRRAQIYAKMHDGVKLSNQELRRTIREHERQVGVTGIINALAHSEFYIAPGYAEVAQDVSGFIIKKYPNVRAVYLGGGGIHGGGGLRLATGNRIGDFDWGLLSDSHLDPDEVRRIVKSSEKIISDSGKRHGLGNKFRSCHSINPTQNMYVNLEDEAAADNLILGVSSKGWAQNLHGQKTVALLEPSFPSQVNEQNRQLMIGALERLSSNNHDRWQIAIDEILKHWQEVHHVKFKHIQYAPKSRDVMPVVRVVDNSPIIMSLTMRELFEATDKSERSV